MERNIEIENKIKEYFSNFKTLKKKTVSLFLDKNEEIKKYLNEILIETPEYLNIFNLVLSFKESITLSKCKTCGKLIDFKRRANTFCSRKCSSNDKEVIDKMISAFEKTCLEKYGTKSYMNTSEFKMKSKRSMKEKYGVDNAAQSSKIQEKIKETNLKKYGYERSSKNDLIKEKKRKTCIEKYGGNAPICSKTVKDKFLKTMVERYDVEFSIQNKESNEKRKETLIKNHGVSEVFLSEELRNKAKQTLLEKYGVENCTCADEVKEKLFKTMETRYGANVYNKSFDAAKINFEKLKNRIKDYVIPLFSESDYFKKDSETVFKWKCIKCGNIFEQKIHSTNHLKSVYQEMPRCLNCFPLTNGFSYSELELLDFCKEHFPSASKDRQLIKPLELDVVIPEIKLALEFNGSYFHSIDNERGVSKDYHLNKTKLCNEKGYRLIHIWEDEWDSSKEEIKKKLIDIFEGRENLNFTDDKIELDASWYNNVVIPGYVLTEETHPEIVNRNGFDVENCGHLILEKLKND